MNYDIFLKSILINLYPNYQWNSELYDEGTTTMINFFSIFLIKEIKKEFKYNKQASIFLFNILGNTEDPVLLATFHELVFNLYEEFELKYFEFILPFLREKTIKNLNESLKYISK